MKKALIIVLGVAGCADILDIPDPVPASEARCSGTIKIKMLVDLNGPTGDLGLPWFKATMDQKRDINEKGGILGCPLDIDVVDYGYNEAAAKSTYEGWRLEPGWNEVAAVLGWGSQDTLLLGKFVAEDRKPFISGSYISEVAAPGEIQHTEQVPELPASFQETKFSKEFKSPGYAYNFFAGTDYSTGARIAMFHARSAGGKRIGFFHCGSRYCTDPLDAARLYAKEQQLELGRDLLLELSGPTVSQELFDAAVFDYFKKEMDHKTEDPSYVPVDWVWGGNTTNTTALMAKAIAKANGNATLNLNPKVQFIVNNFGFNEILFEKCGAACVETVHGIMPHKAYGDLSAADMPIVTALHDRWRLIDGDDVNSHKNAMYVLGYVNLLVFRKAAERVIRLGKDVTGESIKDALETFNAEPTGGLTAAISFTPTDHRPQGTESIYKFDALGRLIPEGNPRPISMLPEWKGW